MAQRWIRALAPEKLPMTPRGGAIGSEVTVGTAGLPPEETMLIAFANLQSYELLRRIETDKNGAFTATIRVPLWAEVDTAHYVFVSRLDERPIKLTEAFHVTAEDGVAHTRGRVVARNGSCLEIRTAAEVIYHLTGTADAHQVGDFVLVKGAIGTDPHGEDGLSIAVTAIEKLPGL